ncbi:MAG: hypothetical protein NXI01_01415 [Gammaproteobacteria bacterium]|nr:hypothetical protein [Gammaproteobacteria bacterium]
MYVKQYFERRGCSDLAEILLAQLERQSTLSQHLDIFDSSFIDS